jgi:hypothetical protein
MKYFLQFFLLLIISLSAPDAYASRDANPPNFPTQLGEYKLVTEQPHIISYEPKECFTFSGDVILCQDYWSAPYKSKDGNFVFVNLSNITSGYDIKKAQTVATKSNISSKGVYLSSENHVQWFTGNNTQLSSYKFNHVTISQAKVNYIGNETYVYDYLSTSPQTTDVYKYFIEYFPPEQILPNANLVNKIKNPDTNMSLIFKNISEHQTFIAEKEYKIKIDTYNIDPNVKIYFDLSYKNMATGKMTISSVQILKNKKGEYVWKVPKYLAYGDKNSTNNYIYKINAGVIGLNGKMLYETQTPNFRIISKGNKKSDISFTEFPDNGVYFKGKTMTMKWISNPHDDRYEIDLVSKKGNKNYGSIYDSVATEDFPASFNWTPYSSLKNGKYYFLIKGYVNGIKTSEGKSKVFEIK